MIENFLGSWALFHDVYLVGVLIGLLLSQIGVLVVARNQIFLSAAIAQASTLGVAVGMWFVGSTLSTTPGWATGDHFLSVMAVLFAVVATLMTHGKTGIRSHSYEATTGWIFLVSGSSAILLMAHSPHGLEEVHRLLLSSIIGSNRTDVWLFTALGLTSTAFILSQRRRVLLYALDPTMARAIGMDMRLWGLGASGWLGLCAGLSMRASGMLYTFGCLVMPALIAANLSREVGSMFVIAPVIALLTAVSGFVLANHYDYPPAQLIVALLCAIYALSWALRVARA